MTDVTPQAFAIKFKNDFILQVQQKNSRLQDTVRTDPDFLEGKYGYYDRIGPTTAQTKTSRHGDTPLIDIAYSRRRILRTTRQWATMIDRSDVARMAKNPQGRVQENARMAYFRDLDDFIIAAATGNSFAIDQDDGATAVPLPATQKVAAAATGLTLTKVLTGMEILDHNEVDDDEERYFAATAHQITQMLNTTSTTNQFYLQIQQLQEGKINYFAKFNWRRSERLQIDPANAGQRMNLAYAKRALGLAAQGDPFVDAGPRKDKQVNWQLYMEWEVGATRIEDECLVQVNCVEP